jgi:hypothetical protein
MLGCDDLDECLEAILQQLHVRFGCLDIQRVTVSANLPTMSWARSADCITETVRKPTKDSPLNGCEASGLGNPARDCTGSRCCAATTFRTPRRSPNPTVLHPPLPDHQQTSNCEPCPAFLRNLREGRQRPHPPKPLSSAHLPGQPPCPATESTTGACPGYVVDHILPLKRGGADDAGNMQWQTIEEAKTKDRAE